MSEMFKHYPQPEDYIPNNRPKHCKWPKLEIMSGETAIHTFEIPFNVNEDTIDFEVIYKQGVGIIVCKTRSELEEPIITEDGKSLIEVTLTAGETSLFSHNILDTHVQIKFTMNDGSITFSEIYKIKVRNALNTSAAPYPPTPGTTGGIGYTED